ncbi:MAG: RagB/SusD family nutrient uptake outer membrane protein [Bacteroidales bacterium]|mgnify:CR=1 FL=1|nr:RagB/SusD family nutrient uptake outer membrane protein [Bacteroidales bacterium]MBQ3613091.1 RagB/SusD family nutrient uptake outer membrane protein [Bacteroidales bacterium]
MRKHIRYIFILLAAAMSAACIQEVFPVGGSQTQSQVSASNTAMMSMIKAIPASMTTSGTVGYANSYGDHTDFGIPGIHLRLEHMLEDMATMAENPFYNRFYAYDMNEAQGYQYTYCAYFWDAYYTWIRLANDVILSVKPVVEAEEGSEDEEAVSLADILGQAYVYRAMCYLDLARLYEPKVNGYTDVTDAIIGLTVPIVDENTTIEQTKNNPRVSREKMYRFIIADLENALELLDESERTFSRPTRYAVYGLLARTYLELGYAEDPAFPRDEMFAMASEYARLVIDEGGYSPLTQSQWEDPVNGFNNAASNNAWIWGFSLVAENLNNLLTFVSHISSEASWGYARYAQFGVSAKLYDQIPDTDFRKHSWLDPKKEEYYAYRFAGTSEDKQKFLTGNPAAKAYQALKFRPAMGECSDFNIGNAADYCMMRVEEMYFIEIEAQAQLKGAEEGKRLLKKFMNTYRDASYSRNPGTMQDFLTEMLLQKRVEFWGEGILLYDYKRLDMGITRAYPGSNHAGVFKYNTTGRSPQWNIVITRAEFQSNTAINDSNNNPDPSGKIELAQ